MLNRLNTFIERKIALITPLCMGAGILASSYIEPISFMIPWLFAFMTFSSSLGIHYKKVGEVIRSPLPIFLCLIVLQAVIPSIAYGVGYLLFPNDPETITGLVLAFIIPTAIASLIWVSLYNGNSSLTLSIVLINTLLSPIFIPLTLYILFNTTVTVDIGKLMSGLCWMIVLPSILGMIANHFSRGTIQSRCSYLPPLSKICLLMVVVINGSVVAPYFKDDLSSKLFIITFVVFCIASSAYIIGLLTAKLFRFNYETVISLFFTCGMRNIGVGSALAIVYFSPAVALPVVVGTLFQQILASILGRLFIKKKETKEVRLTQIAN